MKICIIGLGYVGYPLYKEFSKKYDTYGIDLPKVVESYNDDKITDNYSIVESCDFIFVCAPTPIDTYNKPDTKALDIINENLSHYVRKGQIFVYESTINPNYLYTIYSILCQYKELYADKDFFVVISPERVSPGETCIQDYVKLIACSDENARKKTVSLYESIGIKTYELSNPRIASCAKLLENVQRDVNISLMNEFASICEKINLPFDEVLKAASTKKGFNYYNRGLVGGHCIPVDGYYLLKDASYSAEEMNRSVIVKARNYNEDIIKHIGNNIINNFKNFDYWCILGASYKENVDDLRESGSLKLYNYLIKNIPSDKYVVIHDFYQKKYSYLLEDADCYILATPHKEYENFILNLKKPLYDIRGTYYGRYPQALYYSFGN